MKNLVHFALSVLFLLGIASAQNIPAVDVFGGYSYMNFEVPSSGAPTTQQRLKLNGWEFSASIFSFHHLSLEGSFSDHWLNNCGGTSLKCDNFTWGLGPRFTLGDRSNRFTGFVHGLVGQDRADILAAGTTVSDTSVALAAGGGVDYWLFRHVGLQFGPVDYVFARHLNNFGAANQSDFRAAGGIAFRFGGNFPPAEPKAPKEPKAQKEPKAKSEGGHRSWIRPWRKSKPAPSEGQPSETPAEGQSPTPVTSAPQPAQPPRTRASVPVTAPSRGMQVHPLGIVAAPQEFDGAKILSIEPGSVAEMASLKPGDLIKSVDGKAVRTPMELAAELADKTGKVRIGILRGTYATETVVLLGGH
ncbi:MAG: PDZ domain-containing protein [Terriglobales bacterium]